MSAGLADRVSFLDSDVRQEGGREGWPPAGPITPLPHQETIQEELGLSSAPLGSTNAWIIIINWNRNRSQKISQTIVKDIL